VTEVTKIYVVVSRTWSQGEKMLEGYTSELHALARAKYLEETKTQSDGFQTYYVEPLAIID
jgi:hypothetical protein